MTDYASFNGERVISGSVEVPSFGLWAADVVLESDSTVGATGPLVFGDVSLAGTVYRSFAYAGQIRARLVGGYGGWLKQVPAFAYSLATGLSLSGPARP